MGGSQSRLDDTSFRNHSQYQRLSKQDRHEVDVLGDFYAKMLVKNLMDFAKKSSLYQRTCLEHSIVYFSHQVGWTRRFPFMKQFMLNNISDIRNTQEISNETNNYVQDVEHLLVTGYFRRKYPIQHSQQDTAPKMTNRVALDEEKQSFDGVTDAIALDTTATLGTTTALEPPQPWTVPRVWTDVICTSPQLHTPRAALDTPTALDAPQAQLSSVHSHSSGHSHSSEHRHSPRRRRSGYRRSSGYHHKSGYNSSGRRSSKHRSSGHRRQTRIPHKSHQHEHRDQPEHHQPEHHHQHGGHITAQKFSSRSAQRTEQLSMFAHYFENLLIPALEKFECISDGVDPAVRNVLFENDYRSEESTCKNTLETTIFGLLIQVKCAKDVPEVREKAMVYLEDWKENRPDRGAPTEVDAFLLDIEEILTSQKLRRDYETPELPEDLDEEEVNKTAHNIAKGLIEADRIVANDLKDPKFGEDILNYKNSDHELFDTRDSLRRSPETASRAPGATNGRHNGTISQQERRESDSDMSLAWLDEFDLCSG